jgi:rhodanese-related sulfurtransferase
MRRIKISCFIGVLIVAPLFSACGFTKPENLKMISPAQLHSTLQNRDILLIDVHIPEQVHIAGTDLFIPFYKISSHLDKFPQDKNAPIYLYCKSGPMANWAARTLFDHGYTTIYNLEGGVEAWEDNGYAVPSTGE